MSAFRAFAGRPLSSEQRAELWRRVLADPTQTPRAFAASWFFRDDAPRQCRRMA